MNNRKLKISIIALLLIFAFGFCANLLGVAYGKEDPSGSGTMLISNNILKVAIENESLSEGIGTYTIGTDAGHSDPEQDVLYNGADEYPWSSFTTIRVEDTLKEYVTSTSTKTPSPGYTVEYLDDYSPAVVMVSDTRATVSWTTAESLLITLLIDIRGTTIADTMIQVTVTVQNDDTVTHSVAIRYQWDIMIDGEDDSWIRVWTDPSTAQSWTENETDWVSPSFQFWETTNNPTTPVFSIYGSTILPLVTPLPTPPDRLVYASWAACDDTAYDYSPWGDWDMDSALLYYWNAMEIEPESQFSRTAYLTTVQTELGAFAWSTDSVGNPKSTFNMSDNLYLQGQDFPADTNVTIYLIPDGTDALPVNAAASSSVIVNGTGGLPVTLVWPQPLALGEYDVWVDVNQNGVFDEGDVWNSQSIGIYGLDVIPEFPTLTSTLLLLITLTIAAVISKRNLLKLRIN